MRQRYRYHLGLPFWVYIFITLLIMVGATNSQNNLLFLAFGIALSAAVVSGFLSGAMLMGLRVERSLPSSGVAGVTSTARYTITNTNRLTPCFALYVEEERRSARARDRWTGVLETSPAAVMHIGPGESVEVNVPLMPKRRGEARLAGVRISSSFPFGIISKSVTSLLPATMLVHPRWERLRREAAANLISRAEAGLTSTSMTGRGDEFYGLREYIPGDSPRLISWRASARSGELVVREHAMPASGSLWIILNLSEQLAAPRNENADDASDPNEQAIVLVASLVEAALEAGSDVGFVAPGRSEPISPGATGKQRAAIFGSLAKLDLGATADPRGPKDDELHRLMQRSACIVVHAGTIDPTVGPAHAKHLAASDLSRITTRHGTQPSEKARA